MTGDIRKIGSFELIREIGRGGMGVVYLARDTKLDRNVAIKALPEDLTEDADRLARFEREAKLLASLNHSHIATIHGLEEADGDQYLILEYVQGETLAECLERGSIPVDETLSIAKQIAEAVESAHERGIIHRDLKPANIKFTESGEIKVLDFGLAKAIGPQALTATEIADSPTVADPSPTLHGTILGTAGYLSPEQARGHPVDKRTDIFSFGCLLYEMLTGRMTFTGKTATDSIGAALHKEPDWTLLPRGLPRSVHLLLRRCLAKDRKQRLRDIGDARIAIEDAVSDVGGSSLLLGAAPPDTGSLARNHGRLWLAAMAALSVLSILVAGWSLYAPTNHRPVTRLTISLPSGYELTSVPAISPDGRMVSYTARHDEDDSGLFVRGLNEYDHRLLVEGERPSGPFFSPNGRHIGFFDDDQLWRVDVGGGTPTALADAPIPFGGTWGPDDDIVFTASLNSGLHRIDASGGSIEQITSPDAAEGGYAHVWPHYDRRGESLTFTIWGAGNKSTARLSIEPLHWEVVNAGPSHARLIGSNHLLYSDQEGWLRAVLFNADDGQIQSEPISVLASPLHYTYTRNRVWYDFATNGTLIYVPTSGFSHRLTWIDRETGVAEEIATAEAAEIALSPDGEKVLYTSQGALWMYDLIRGTRTRIESQPMIFTPEWDPGGESIYFSSNRSGDWELYSKNLVGAEPAERILEQQYAQHISSVARDGTLAFWDTPPDAGTSIWVMAPGEQPRFFLDHESSGSRGRFSPGVDLLAYTAANPPHAEVFLVTFPHAGERVQVSIDGGQEPVWSPDGEQLFYRKGDDIMAVSVDTDNGLSVSVPHVILQDLSIAKKWSNYRISPDGERFLVLQRDPDAVPRQINVILEWTRELKEGTRPGS